LSWRELVPPIRIKAAFRLNQNAPSPAYAFEMEMMNPSELKERLYNEQSKVSARPRLVHETMTQYACDDPIRHTRQAFWRYKACLAKCFLQVSLHGSRDPTVSAGLGKPSLHIDDE
jgi:hypothetical protein